MNLHDLYAELARRRLVVSATPPPFTFGEKNSLWYTRALLGFMGWLGGTLVLGFFGSLIAGLFNSGPGMAILAVIMVVASFSIYRVFAANEFSSQFSLAASICGQALAVGAFDRLFHPKDFVLTAWFLVALQFALVWIMPNFLHRLLSTMFAVLALFVATKDNGASAAVCALLGFGFVLLCQAESVLVARGRRAISEPVLAGLAVGLLAAGVAYLRLFGSAPLLPFAPMSALAFALSLLLWIALATRGAATGARVAAFAAAVAFAAAAWRAPGLLACALVLLASFSSGRRALTGLAMVALIGYLSTYYYQMNLTLALKSAVLAASACVLLVCWWVHRRYFYAEAA